MNRTDDQIDAIVLARDIMIQRAGFYKRRANQMIEGKTKQRMNDFAIVYESAVDILTAALNENWELLRNYEGA